MERKKHDQGRDAGTLEPYGNRGGDFQDQSCPSQGFD